MTKLLVLNLLVVSAQFYDTTAFYNKRAMPGQMEPELIEVVARFQGSEACLFMI